MGAAVIQNRPVRLLPYLWLVVAVAAFAYLSYGVGDQILHRPQTFDDAPTAPVLASLIVAALALMFVIRPAIVFMTIGVYGLLKGPRGLRCC